MTSNRDGRESGPGGRRFSLGKQVLFTVIIVCGLLLLAEGIVRVWALYFRTSYERYDERTGRLELRPNIRYTNARGEEFRINSKGFVGPEFEERPAAGVYRVIAVGDSCTFATGFWRIGYPSQLERMLNEGRPDRRFEVINAGIEGYNSTFALARIRDELLPLHPRLMIIYIGWNDLMKTDPASESSVDSYRWLARWLEASYLVKAYKKLLFVNLRPLVVRPATAVEAGGAPAFENFQPTRYRSNLEQMIRLLRQHDVNVLLVTLPTVVRPGMSKEELRRSNVFFPYFAGAYGVPQLLSLHGAYNRTIIQVAKEQEVPVVDLARRVEVLHDRSPYFWDTMHPNEKGNALIAEALSTSVRALANEARR